MDFSPRLSLPFLLPGQAQKHVTLNEGLARLDAIVQLVVRSAAASTPPAVAGEGDAWIMPEGSLNGAWASSGAGQVASWRDGAWDFVSPGEGWTCFDLESGTALRFLQGVWHPDPNSALMPQLGINTVSDGINRLSVKADAELLSHDDVTPGSGDARKVINKAGASATAATLFQSGWSGRAEIGLIGDEDLSFKVSDDGIGFTTCARFDRFTGAASFPAGQVHAPSGVMLRQFLPTPGGDGIVSIFRINAQRGANPRSFALASVLADTLTLNTAQTNEVFEPAAMSGVSMVRIWNMTRAPIRPAWVVASPSATSLQVRDGAELDGWLPGDVIQIGDPTSQTPGRVIAVDISPMMLALFGVVFYQSGVLAKLVAQPAATGEAGLDLSPDGVSGSFLGTRGYVGAASISGQVMIPCSLASPVSASNLVCVREQDLGHGMGISVVSINALVV